MSFNIGSGFDAATLTCYLSGDTKLYVGGGFTSYNGVTGNSIIRLNTDGTVDAGFNSGSGFDSEVYAIVKDANNDIYVGGIFDTYRGNTSKRLVRINSDGTYDSGFAVGSGFTGTGTIYVEAIAIDSNGKIYVGGKFTAYNGTAVNNLIRLNTDGSIDTGFAYGSGANGLVYDIKIDANGKILITGAFTTWNGSTSNYIARLNTNGSIDSSFVTGTGFDNNTTVMAIDSGGDIYVGGNFTTYSGVTKNGIVRLNSNGSIDSVFNIGTGFNTAPFAIKIDTGGKILVTGTFISYNGTTANRIIRLTNTGAIDTTFNIGGAGFDDVPIDLIEMDSLGNFYLTGFFTKYNGQPYNYIIKLNSYGSSATVVDDTLFYSTWNTTLTSVGSSTSSQIQLPLVNGGTYNFVVNWGDGSTSTITTWNDVDALHTYASSGIYEISISGTCTGWMFNNTGDKLKLLNISNWGSLKLTQTYNHFFGCQNLDITATDIPDISGISFDGLFQDCYKLKFNDSINSWNTSGNTSLIQTFYNCYVFNQPLDNWDVSNVTAAWYTFSNCYLFNQNLNTWDTSNFQGFGAMFSGCYVYNQPMSNWDTSGANPANNNNFFSMFTNCLAFNQDISQFDVSAGKNFNYMFNGCYKFNQDISSWDTHRAIDMQYMFYNAYEFNQNIGGWITSGVTNMKYMLARCYDFNYDIGGWDTGNVTDMQYMFFGCNDFNQNLNTWNTSKVTNLSGTFQDCLLYSQPMNSWDVSKVTLLTNTFRKCYVFNQPLNTWVTSGVTNMTGTFADCLVFNQPLNSWNTSALTGQALNNTFDGCHVFNQDLDNWNTTNVTGMGTMFRNCWVFNGDITTWNVTKVQFFGTMFYNAYAFNQDISGWVINTTTNVQMSYMFSNAYTFNQPIGSWNIIKNTTIRDMFREAHAFNQDLSGWDYDSSHITSTLDFQYFVYGSALSQYNYDLLLNKWANTAVKTGVTFRLNQYYCDTTSHNTLDTTKTWTFYDNGIDSGCSGFAPSGLTVTLIGNCIMEFNWTNAMVYDYIEIQNFGSWITIATVGGAVDTYQWTGTPTSNVFRVVGFTGGFGYPSLSTVGEIPPAISSTIVRNAQCGPFDYSSGRIIYLFANLLTGHTYTFSVFSSDLSLYYQQTGMTSTDTFFVDDVPDGCYLGQIDDTTCNCTVDVQQYCVESLLPFALGGVKKLYITPWSLNVDYNYWSTADEDYYLGTDSSFFLSTKIKEYLSLSGGNLTWYEIPVLPQIVSVQQSLGKVRQGYVFQDTLNFGVAKANAQKWTQMQTLLNPENKWIYALLDADNNYWTGGFMHGAKITAYNYKTGARQEDNGYGLTVTAVSENKILTSLDEAYVTNYIK